MAIMDIYLDGKNLLSCQLKRLSEDDFLRASAETMSHDFEDAQAGVEKVLASAIADLKKVRRSP